MRVPVSKRTFPVGATRTAFFLFTKAHKVVSEHLERAVETTGALSVTGFEVLWILYHSGGRLPLNELPGRMELSQSRVSRQVAALEARGLVVREVKAADRRSSVAVLTDAGRSLYLAVEQPFLDAWHAHFMSHLSPDDVTAFNKILAKLAHQTGGWDYGLTGELSEASPAKAAERVR